MSDHAKALAAVRSAQVIQVAMPEIEAVLAALDDRVRREMMQQISRGVLDPAAAVQAWLQLHANDRLRERLTKVMHMGQSSGEEVSETMTLEEDNAQD